MVQFADLYVVSFRQGTARATRVAEVSGMPLERLAAGYNQDTVIGNGSTAMSFAYRYCDVESDQMPETAAQKFTSLNGSILNVAFGKQHFVACTTSGDVYTCGNGADGQLGSGSRSASAELRLVTQLAEKQIIQVACGDVHTLALSAAGDMFSWGGGFEGQLGLGKLEVTLTPRYISKLQGTSIMQIAAGARHSAALSQDGRIFCWGDNYCGQLAAGRRAVLDNCRVPCPVLSLQATPMKSIACGFNHTAALSVDGTLYTWGLASKGPTTGDKFEPELVPSAVRFAQVVCSAESTALLSESGAVYYFAGQGAPMTMVSDLGHLPASELASTGSALLVLVRACVLHMSPQCAPLRGGTTVSLQGAGFFGSSALWLRFRHALGSERLVRATYHEAGALAVHDDSSGVVQAQAPSFEIEGPGDVSVAVSLDGSNFSAPAPMPLRYYEEPTEATLAPDAAAASGGTELFLTVGEKSAPLIDSRDAIAKLLSPKGDVIGTAPASFVAEKQLRIVFPSISLGDEKFMQALVEIALDGQTSAPEIQSQLFLYSPPTFEAPNPLWVSAEGGAVVRIKADPLFQSAALRVRLDALLPFDGFEEEREPVAVATTEETAGDAAEGAASSEMAKADGATAEGATDATASEQEAEAALPRAPEPIAFLPESFTRSLAGRVLEGADHVSVTLPKMEGVGRLSVSVALNGIDFTRVPGELRVYETLRLRSVLPARGRACGGTTLTLRGDGLRASPDLSVLFVKGARREIVKARYDEAVRCVLCETPAWVAPPVEPADADADAEADAIAPNAPVADDVIVEVGLNTQQWTRNCLHYLFQDFAFHKVEPAVGPLVGGTLAKLIGAGFSDCVGMKARFTDPVTAVSFEVDATFVSEMELTCNTPAFGAPKPFDTQVLLTVNGQEYSSEAVPFRFEGNLPKGSK